MGESVKLTKFIEEFELEKIYETKDIDSVMITSADVNRPGLQLAGFYEYFDAQRVQLMGKVEFTYLEKLPTDERGRRLEEFFKHDFPCLVITRSMQIFLEMMDLAEQYNKNLLRIDLGASEFMSACVSFLKVELAPRRTRHGVLVDVYGEGILIMGESGVGKSEAAIELVKRGHRLVADDAVEIRRISDKKLIGSSPEIIRHFVEVRGIGIIDVKEIFGIGAVMNSGDIDMIIHLEPGAIRRAMTAWEWWTNTRISWA